MRMLVMVAGLATAAVTMTPAVAQSTQADQRFESAQQRFDRELSNYRREVDLYRQSRNDQSNAYRNDRYGSSYDNRANDNYYDDPNYDPARDYRDGSSYEERVLASNDRVYRGTDGRYYCKRNDGTTGLIVGALGGGLLGNIIDGGRSRAVGTILGALGGAAAGRAVDRNSGASSDGIRCR